MFNMQSTPHMLCSLQEIKTMVFALEEYKSK